MAFSTPGRVVLGLPSPSPRVCTDGRTDGWTYADVTTKIFRIDGLPNLLSNGAPLAGFARRLRYNDLATEISKLKKIMKYLYPLKRYNVLKFEFVTKNSFTAIRMETGPIWEITLLPVHPLLL